MQEIHFFDLRRWLLGDAPTWFILEITIRALFLYALLQLVLRLMGHRLAAQLTAAELAIMLTIGGAVVTPMLFPNIGLIAVIVILGVAIFFQWGISWITLRHQKVEAVAIGKVVTILEDGRLLVDAMEQIGISHERINSVLRLHSVQHLGELRRIYAEPSGDFSIYHAPKEAPGLSVMPDFDMKLHFKESVCKNCWACSNCGFVKKNREEPKTRCDYCDSDKWMEAMISIPKE